MSTPQQAWGKWGADDERGAVNAIGPEQVHFDKGQARKQFRLGRFILRKIRPGE